MPQTTDGHSKGRWILAALAMPVLAACGYGLWLILLHTGLPTEVPDDFAVEYSTGPCHADWGPRQYVGIGPRAVAAGPVEFQVTRWVLTPAGRGTGGPPAKTVTSVQPVSREKLLALYREVCWQRFFSMQPRYYDPGIIDGGGGRLEVTAGGRKKSVSVTNTRVRAFDRLVAMVQALP